MAPITVAIAGATGLTGAYLTRAFLSPAYYPEKVGRVIAFTRDPSSRSSQELKALGAELQTSGPTAEVFKGVDVLANALNQDVSLEVKDPYIKAAAEAGVKVYFTPEFGFDHYTYQNTDHIFEHKRTHDKLARSLNGGSIKVVSILNASFLESGALDYAGAVGLDHDAGVYTAIGSPDTKVTFNSLTDIASSVVRLSLLAIENPASVPDSVRLNGDARSFKEIAEIVGKETGKTIQVKSIDQAEYTASAPDDFVRQIRLRFATGEADFSQKNDNEVVNPGQKYWKWKTVEDYTKERKGAFGF